MFRQFLPAANVFSISLTGGVGAGSASDGGSAWTWLIPTIKLRTRVDKTREWQHQRGRTSLSCQWSCTPPIAGCVEMFATSLLGRKSRRFETAFGTMERAAVADRDGHDRAVS